MSAKLIKAVNSGTVVIRKVVSGEIHVVFNNGQSIAVNHSNLVELTKLTGITPNDCLLSNLEKLIVHGAIDVVL